MRRATAFAPGSIGNVGPGFDVLGLAVEACGDRVTVELSDAEPRILSVTGRDAHLIPLDPEANVAMIAARAWLRSAGADVNPILSIEKGLPLSGGLGGSAASSVAGALAASAAAGVPASPESIMLAALEGESLVSGPHLDNIGPSVLGGLTLVRSVDPLDVVRLHVREEWYVALLTPDVRVDTRNARALLPEMLSRAEWIPQMANTASMVHAFASGDASLMRRSLVDHYAEPARAGLIPQFHEIKKAALDNGSFGCSISGSGPTVFALVLAADAHRCVEAMAAALGRTKSIALVSRIDRQGARVE
jgi:homoserine kinase